MSITPAPEQAILTQEQELNLKDYAQIILRRKSVFIQVFVMVFAIGVVITLLSKPVYQTQAKLSILMAPPQVTLQDVSNPLAAIAAGLQPDSVGTTLQVLSGGPFQAEAKELAKVTPRPSVVPPAASVEQIENSNVIKITVTGGDPAEIQRYANQLVDLHILKSRAASKGNVEKTLAFIKREKIASTKKLFEAEEKLADFKRVNRIALKAADEQARAQDYSELVSKRRAAQSNIASTEATVADLQRQLRREPENTYVETSRENPIIPKLNERLSEQRLLLIDAMRDYREKHPKVVAISDTIAAMEKQLASEKPQITTRIPTPNPMKAQLRNQLASLQANLYGYRADFNSATSLLRTVQDDLSRDGGWEVDLNRLTRERDIAQATYTTLAEKERDLQIRDNIALETIRKIEVAGLPNTPVRPRKVINILLTAILALFLATAMALLQEFLDDRINSPDDIDRLAMLPTLGHVPQMSDEKEEQLVSQLPATSHVAEAYRALRSSIGFASIDAPLRRLQVTSASKGEGKSTTAVNLATAMAMDGKRVILVDADLRRPNVHKLLGLPSAPGFSEVLVGMAQLEDVIQNTDVENLRVITAGPIPPNPAELLGSHAFADVVEQLEKMADVVMFDTPPCMPVTDPLIVAARMDGVVLVLNAGQTRKAAVKHAIEMLRRARARVLGVVFNRVQANKSGYYYHYYYYYGDGYYAEEGGQNDQRGRKGGRRRKGALGSGKQDKGG
jgi:capsular exopolysaccharide synthesis family protein